MGILTLVFILFVIYLIFDFIKKNKISNIKGPLSLPLIGGLYKLGKSPHEDITKLYKIYGRVMRLYMGDQYTLIITDPVLLREIFVKNFDNFVERTRSPIFKKTTDNYRNFISGDEEYWRPYKTVLSNSFTKTTLKTHVSNSIDSQTEQIIEFMKGFSQSGQPFNPRKFIQRYTFNVIMKYVINEEIPFGDGDGSSLDNIELMKIFDDIEVLFKQLGSANICDFVNILKPFYEFYLFNFEQPTDRLRRFMYKKSDEHIKSYDKSVTRDLMDNLINQLGTDTESAVRAVTLLSFDLLLAGSETSANTIEWVLLLLGNHQEYQDKCYDELKSYLDGSVRLLKDSDKSETPYTMAFIKEVMRTKPIGPLGLPRRAKEDIWINDIFIPKDTQIIQNIHGFLKSEEFWDNPLEFKPDRFLNDLHSNHFVPFGVGPRQCIGMSLAYHEIYSAISNIILNFKVKPFNSTHIDDTEIFGLTIHPNEFSLSLEKR